MRLLLAILFAMLASPVKTEISLKNVLSFGMPGTRSVDELAREVTPLADQIKKSLQKATLREAFAVEGEGEQALVNAHAVLTGKRKPTRRVAGRVSLVFFSHLSARHVQINTIRREENVFTIKYQAVSYEAGVLTTQLALIPLGLLDEGEYEVKVKELPTLTTGGWEAPPLKRGIVCESFRFKVRR